MENMIVARSLTCKVEGQLVEATVYLGIPLEEQGGGWICEYGVVFSTGTRKHIHKIVGEDSMQALQLAMAMLGSTLLSLQGTSDWRWNDEPYTGIPSSTDEPLCGSMQ